jgi:hypothetical protein
LRVEWLEARLQPGSLLGGDLVAPFAADALAPPEAPPHASLSALAVRSNLADDTPALTSVTAPGDAGPVRHASRPAAAPLADTGFADAAAARAPARAASGLSLPALHAPAGAGGSLAAPPAGSAAQTLPFGAGRLPVTVSNALQVTPARGTVQNAGVKAVTPKLTVEHVDCHGGSGTKAATFNSYVGTAALDQVVSVTAPTDGFIGQAVAGGTEGTKGFVFSYTSTGACNGGFTISDASASVSVRGVVANINGVYAVGTVAAPDNQAFIYRFDQGLTTVLGNVSYLPNTGGTVGFNGVAVQPTVVRDVFAVGANFDPAVKTYNRTFVVSTDLALAPKYATTVDFGADTRGLAIDADRGGNAYIGDRLSSTATPLTFRLNSGGGSLQWGFTDSAGSPVMAPNNGMHGVSLLPGGSAANGLYTVGSIRDSVTNPGFDMTLVVKWNPATGTPLGYNSLYSSTGSDFAGLDNAVDRSGQTYATGTVGTTGNHLAFVVQIDPTGSSITQADTLGGAASDSAGRGVAVVTMASTTDAIMGGSTNTPTAAMAPAPSGCQTTYSGGGDGFISKWTQPF